MRKDSEPRADDRLSGEDAAWLHMERATSPMVVDAVLELASRLSVASARPVLDRLASRPRFRSRVVDTEDHLTAPVFEPLTDFDVMDQVQHVELPTADDGALRAYVGEAVSTLLDPRRPLWRVFFIDRPGRGTTLLFRVHHAIADGFALLGVLLSLCDDGASRQADDVIPRPAHTATLHGAGHAVRHLLTSPADRPTLLKRPLSLHKRVAWTKPIPLTLVKGLARGLSATVNDVLVAVTAGALGRYLVRRGESTSGLELHAMVPVNLRPPGPSTELGNEFGLVLLGLPVGMGDPVARVAAVRQRMETIKGTPEAAIAHELLRTLGRVPLGLEELAVSFFAKKTSLVLTNVPGPRARLSLAGSTVERIMFWVPQAGRLGLGISIFSYAGEVSVGVIADAELVPDPDALAADFDDDLRALSELTPA